MADRGAGASCVLFARRAEFLRPPSRSPSFSPSHFFPHVNLYRALKEVALTASIWGHKWARGQALPADMKAHPSTPCPWYLQSTPSDHLYLHNLGLIKPKQKPCVNYLWRCNDFRAAADSHMVSKPRAGEQVTLQTPITSPPTCALFGDCPTLVRPRELQSCQLLNAGRHGTACLTLTFPGLLNE